MTMESEIEKNKGTVVLVAFNNIKALGVRYLETALRGDGYHVFTIFFGDFDSANPRKTTKTELQLLREQIKRENPMLIGLSVMSSMYLDMVDMVMENIRGAFDVPIVCGGAYASLCPDYFLQRQMNFVIRTDGERSICQLADAIRQGEDYRNIPSLCYKNQNETIINKIGNICENIDCYGIPTVHCKNACHIHHDKVVMGDPQLNTLSYEMIAYRGCPFTCSYCSCVSLRRLFPSGTKYVRTCSVSSVINELIEAKRECKKLVFIHFYDEIFPNSPGWIDAFVQEYKKYIRLPFTIWGHPKAIKEDELRKLVEAGLTEVIMGIQSGSSHIRKDVFHRYETNEEIISATKKIKAAGVFWASYDFMLQHPFETIEDLKETYYLVKQLYRPFELQLHGLNFLPETDIVPMAIEQGYCTEKEMHDIMMPRKKNSSKPTGNRKMIWKVSFGTA